MKQWWLKTKMQTYVTVAASVSCSSPIVSTLRSSEKKQHIQMIYWCVAPFLFFPHSVHLELFWKERTHSDDLLMCGSFLVLPSPIVYTLRSSGKKKNKTFRWLTDVWLIFSFLTCTLCRLHTSATAPSSPIQSQRVNSTGMTVFQDRHQDIHAMNTNIVPGWKDIPDSRAPTSSMVPGCQLPERFSQSERHN